MTTITLEVPDDLAQRLADERERLPEMLRWALSQLPPRLAHHPASTASLTPTLAFDEMIEFLASHPTPEQILAFRISPRAQARLAELLEKNREDGLTESESAELDWYEYVHDIMTRLKAQAWPAPAG